MGNSITRLNALLSHRAKEVTLEHEVAEAAIAERRHWMAGVKLGDVGNQKEWHIEHRKLFDRRVDATDKLIKFKEEVKV